MKTVEIVPIRHKHYVMTGRLQTFPTKDGTLQTSPAPGSAMWKPAKWGQEPTRDPDQDATSAAKNPNAPDGSSAPQDHRQTKSSK